MASIETKTNLQQFFYDLVREAVQNQGINIIPETEYYLVQLLYRFSKIEEGTENSNLICKDEALVCMLGRAVEANRETSIQILKHLGDLALYIAGYFPESLSRKLIDIDYYVQMGGTAYGSVSAMTPQPHIQSLFQQLSDRFCSWVDILGEVSAQTQFHRSEQDLLKIYDLWNRTGSRHALNLLQKEGIVPHKGNDKSH